MLILSIVTTTLLVMMTQHRIWIFAAAVGALCSWALSQLIHVFTYVLPPAWHVFNGVFAFLAVASLTFWLISLLEKVFAERDEV